MIERGTGDPLMRIVGLTGQRHKKRWPGPDPPASLEALDQLGIALMAGLGRGLQSFQLPLAQPTVGDAVQHTDDVDAGPPQLNGSSLARCCMWVR